MAEFWDTDEAKDLWDSGIIDEKPFIDWCVDYALDTGLVTEKDVPILKEEYLRPIHETYLAAIKDVKDELGGDEQSQHIIDTVTRRLNVVLRKAERIGSTDP